MTNVTADYVKRTTGTKFGEHGILAQQRGTVYRLTFEP